jgi:hypothetical protein
MDLALIGVILFFVVVLILVMVAILRWVLRINDICDYLYATNKKLEKLIELQQKEAKEG